MIVRLVACRWTGRLRLEAAEEGAPPDADEAPHTREDPADLNLAAQGIGPCLPSNNAAAGDTRGRGRARNTCRGARRLPRCSFVSFNESIRT